MLLQSHTFALTEKWISLYHSIQLVLPQSHTPEVNVRIYYANSEDCGTVGAVFSGPAILQSLPKITGVLLKRFHPLNLNKSGKSYISTSQPATAYCWPWQVGCQYFASPTECQYFASLTLLQNQLKLFSSWLTLFPKTATIPSNYDQSPVQRFYRR